MFGPENITTLPSQPGICVLSSGRCNHKLVINGRIFTSNNQCCVNQWSYIYIFADPPQNFIHLPSVNYNYFITIRKYKPASKRALITKKVSYEIKNMYPNNYFYFMAQSSHPIMYGIRVARINKIVWRLYQLFLSNKQSRSCTLMNARKYCNLPWDKHCLKMASLMHLPPSQILLPSQTKTKHPTSTRHLNQKLTTMLPHS